MIVLPAHDNLKDAVQPVEADRQRHLDTPAHRRLNIVEGYRKPGDLILSRHLATVAEPRDEFQGKRSAMRLIGWPSAMLASVSRR